MIHYTESVAKKQRVRNTYLTLRRELLKIIPWSLTGHDFYFGTFIFPQFCFIDDAYQLREQNGLITDIPNLKSKRTPMAY